MYIHKCTHKSDLATTSCSLLAVMVHTYIYVCMYMYVCIYIFIHLCIHSYTHKSDSAIAMEWLRLVSSFKLQVSFAEYSLFHRALVQKRPIILWSLLIVATPYVFCSWRYRIYTYICMYVCIFICRNIYAYVCIYMYMQKHVYVHTCIYTHTHIEVTHRVA